MEKVENLEIVQVYLKEGRILCFFSDHKMVKFMMRNDKLHFCSDTAHYILSWKDFVEVYHQESFYLYEKEDNDIEISKEKDEEYYGWYHK